MQSKGLSSLSLCEHIFVWQSNSQTVNHALLDGNGDFYEPALTNSSRDVNLLLTLHVKF